MKFLLINPKFPDTFWGFHHTNDIGGTRYAMSNLALPTLAAMIPPHHDILLCDENIEPIDFEINADLVCLTGYNIQSPRTFQIADTFRKKGRLVALGGPYASLCPQECESHTDILFVGEGERIWPQFLKDFERGRIHERYEEKEKIDMVSSPIPRWDLVKLQHYGRVPMQTTRGCPFSCEFCDVILYLGQKVRQKTPDQIGAELEALYPHMWRLGRDSVFFADDNFIGNKRHAKETCRVLIEFNKTLKRPLRFSTQVTITLARDKELLELMTETGFHSVFIGIETPKKENLIEANKIQNTTGDLIQDVRTIQSYGLIVWAGMIVGFDNDSKEVFKEQLDFINKANIPISMTGMLNAPANTPLWNRLKNEGRLQQNHQYTDQADTNIIPKNMSVDELRRGYIQLLNELYSYENYSKRLCGTLKAIQHVPLHPKKKFSAKHVTYNISRLAKMLRYYLLTIDRPRRDFFVNTLGQILKTNRHYLKEGLWHLAAHKHFYEYSKVLERNIENPQNLG